MENACYPFANTPLPYAYEALEPHIDAETMRLHHDKHLGAYIDGLNRLLAPRPWMQSMDLEQLIRRLHSFPRELQTPLRRQAGGVYNHRFYFESLSPQSGGRPIGSLAHALICHWGSLEAFQNAFRRAALSVFGSGYAWLIRVRGGVALLTTAGQDTPLQRGVCPLLNVDVWEHAYYLLRQNRRAEYFDAWMQVVDWNVVEARYQRAGAALGK